MRFPTKKELGGRLAGYPLLRLLLFEFWFRLACLGVVFLVLFLAMFLPRIWRVSPSGFAPTVRISGLDWMQARSLRRTALRAETEGRINEAGFAWRTAITYHPCDPELFRGSLRTLLRSDRLPPDLSPILGQSTWLLSLTSTNPADLELVARVGRKLRLDQGVVGLLAPKRAALGPRLRTIYLEALFDTGHRQQFADEVNRRRDRLPPDPELALYLAAAAAESGRFVERAEGAQRLESALSDPDWRIVAARLLLGVAARAGDAPRCEWAFNVLRHCRGDALADHIAYWQLLASQGLQAEAVRLAASCPRTPQTAFETACVAEGLARLGMRAEAWELLEKEANRFIPADPIWLTKADLLIESRQWEGARALALRMRLQPLVGVSLAGYSYFLEGRADLAEDRGASAEAAFRKCAASEFSNPALGLAVAAELDRLRCPVPARDLLLKLQALLEYDPVYWQLLFTVGWELKQPDLVLAAATAAYRLQPADRAVMNNYAAALLLCRRQPEQALVLTLQLIGQDPDSIAARVNHSLALLLNDRAVEADAWLQTIDARTLTGAAATVHAWARFEASVQLHNYDEAARNGKRIEPRYLFPAQNQRLEQQLRRLPRFAATQS